MTTDLTQPSIALRTLVDIELTGLTLRYANDNILFTDGTFYENRAKVGGLRSSFASMLEPRQRQSSIKIDLDNDDGALNTLRDSYFWGNRAVTVRLGAGNVFSDYSIEFKGMVKFPDGIRHNDRRIEITVNDRRNNEAKDIPITLFTLTDYPNLQSGASGRPIPIAYGDWSDKKVPVTCINTSAKTFKVSGHAIQSITAVYKRTSGGAWSSVAYTNTNLTTATFDLSVSYDQTTDEIAVEFAGKEFSAGLLMENPSDIIKDILKTYLGLVDGDLDLTAFANLKTDTSDVKLRRYMDEKRSSNRCLSEILNEVGIDLSVRNGLYYPKFFIPNFDAAAATYDSNDIAEGTFNPQDDPDRLYSNKIAARYLYNPVLGAFDSETSLTDSAAVAQAGGTFGRDVDFYWLYKASDVDDRVRRLLLQHKNVNEMVAVTLRARALQLQLGDIVNLSFSRFADAPMQARAMQKDYSKGTIGLEAFSIQSFPKIGRWTDDSAPNYASATAAQRQTQGFWTNDDGEASPGDAASKVSNWY